MNSLVINFGYVDVFCSNGFQNRILEFGGNCNVSEKRFL